MTIGSIIFQGDRFGVATATIEGVLNTRDWAKFHGQPYGVRWYIELTAKSLDKHAALEISFNGLGLHLTSWLEFAGLNVRWENWQNLKTNSPYVRVEADKIESPDSGIFCVVGSRGNIFAIQSNGRLGRTELYTMDAEFTFQGIRVFGTTKETEIDLRRRLEAELPRDCMLLKDYATNLHAAQPNTSAYFTPQIK